MCIRDSNPDCKVEVHKCFYLPETRDEFDFSSYSYVVDAVDTVTAKIALVMQAQETGTPIISSMGAGNKLNPAMFEVADIYKTSVCPLAKVMRRELKKRDVYKRQEQHERCHIITRLHEKPHRHDGRQKQIRHDNVDPGGFGGADRKCHTHCKHGNEQRDCNNRFYHFIHLADMLLDQTEDNGDDDNCLLYTSRCV